MGRVDGVVFDVAVLHQPRPRPPRLPRRRRGLLRGQGVAVHPRARPARAWSTSTTRTAAGWSSEATVPVRTFSPPARDGRLARRRTSSCEPTGSTFTVHAAGGRAASRRGCRCPATSTSPTRCARSPALRRGRLRRRRGRRRRWPRSGGVPGRLERVDAGQDFLAVVDYAHKPDAVERRAGAAAPADRGPAGRGDRRRRRPRPRQAADHGRDRRPARRRARGHRRQPPQRGPGRDPRRAARRRRRRAGERAEVLEVGDRRAAIGWPCALAGPGDTVWSPARDTRPARRSPAWCTPSTTAVVLREELAGAR